MRGVHRVEEWLVLSQPLLCDRGVPDNYSSRASREDNHVSEWASHSRHPLWKRTKVPDQTLSVTGL
jgi:hypothetical protein